MTREEAISWLKKIKVKYIHGGDEEFDAKRKEALGMAIAALREQDELESKLRALESSDWISVEERLPEDEGKVLAYYGFDRNGNGNLSGMFIGTLVYYCFDNRPSWQHADLSLVVTHWMPLPEPPKEEV